MENQPSIKKFRIQNMRDADELANAHICASRRTANSSTNAHICASRTMRVKKKNLLLLGFLPYKLLPT